MRKERFLTHGRSKLQSRGNYSFKVLEWIKNKAYKLELPCKYNISATFNVSNLSPFDIGDNSKSNAFEKREIMRINKQYHRIHCRCWLDIEGMSQKNQRDIQWTDSGHLGRESLGIPSKVNHEIEFKKCLNQCDSRDQTT